ncbi:endo alpha-1,4 polygalactosaminidase [Cupriavidus sp. BIC8F]|uniref:endo alpha-1,4 polygalactosaminidase n=1 Tax=Cupriavidus sp. BIC8F TaxID=3079014 RepID=UPI002915D4E5|nr:endo alpha-1,4 polygalactosaminidase [Cupriavidus sp. BIC8F]
MHGKYAAMAGATLSVALSMALGGCGGDGGATEMASPAAATATEATKYGTTATTVTSTTTRWMPAITDTWQIQLTGKLNTSYPVVMYDFDLFDTPQATIDALHAKGQRVVCYFSAGSAEDWRPDYSQFTASDLGSPLSGWAGERWVDTRSANVRRIMQARMDLAVSKRCDGVDADNVDGYTNSTGLPLTADTQLDYNRFLATEAHARGLAIGLKNDIDQVGQLAADFDFAVNEQCFQYQECGAYSAFTGQGKAVFNIEYKSRYKTVSQRNALCAAARAANLRTLVMPANLDGSSRYACD